jgi:hypothetical protein
MFLLFILLAQCLLHLTEDQAINELIGPATLAVIVVYARSTLLALGRHVIAGIKSGGSS